MDRGQYATATLTSPAATESTFVGSPSIEQIKPEDGEDGSLQPPKKKQKRNKPTLSCEECVERKTKVSLTKFRAPLIQQHMFMGNYYD